MLLNISIEKGKGLGYCFLAVVHMNQAEISRSLI